MDTSAARQPAGWFRDGGPKRGANGIENLYVGDVVNKPLFFLLVSLLALANDVTRDGESSAPVLTPTISPSISPAPASSCSISSQGETDLPCAQNADAAGQAEFKYIANSMAGWMGNIVQRLAQRAWGAKEPDMCVLNWSHGESNPDLLNAIQPSSR